MTVPGGPFADILVPALLASPLGRTIVYTPAGGSPATMRALIDSPDVQALLGGQLVEQAVLVFTVRKADLPTQPRRGGTVAWNGRSWFVAEPGSPDEEDQTWSFKAARLP